MAKKGIWKRIGLFFSDRMYRFQLLQRYGFLKCLSDKAFLKYAFRVRMGKKLNLKNPKTFNEKLQWLKLYDRDPLYTTMVDKHAVKAYVAGLIGEEHVIPAIGVYERFDEIDFDSLPNQFVMKCTHTSGGVVVCKNKADFDREQAARIIKPCMKRNYFHHGREWPYKNVPARILIETYVQDAENENLPVYKVFCFDGEPKIIQAIQNDKSENESIDYFDTSWNLLDMRQNYPNSKIPFSKPALLDKMMETARKLAKGKPGFIRVDFYIVGENLYFSEYTFFSDSGFAKFTPEEWDEKLGDMLTLPPKKK